MKRRSTLTSDSARRALRAEGTWDFSLLVCAPTLMLSFAKTLFGRDFDRIRPCLPEAVWSGHMHGEDIGTPAGTILRLVCAARRIWPSGAASSVEAKRPRPRLTVFDKVFWILAHRFWSGGKQGLLVVTPQTVVHWHRAGFALFWKAI